MKHARSICSGLLMLSLCACNPEVAFLPSTVVPGAEGYVKIKRDDNQNYLMEIHITNLAESEKLETGKSTYIVWMERIDGTVEKVGLLSTSSSLFSRQHQASLHALSSSKPSKVFVTAETGPNSFHPSSLIVMTTRNF